LTCVHAIAPEEQTNSNTLLAVTFFLIFWWNLTYNSLKDLSRGDKKRLLHKMAWLMFWHGQYFVAVNGLTLLMFWHSRCFGTFDIIEPLMFWCSRTNAGERQSLRDLKYQPHLYTDCTKTLTAPKHRTHRNTDNAGPKGQLVIFP